MTAVEWLAAGEHELPADDQFLTERELAWMGRMRFPKRRLEYRLARWCAKTAIAATVEPAPPVGEVEIGHLPEGAPAGYIRGAEFERRISMTDRAGWAVCAIAPPGIEVGVDLELVETRTPGFVADFFTASERLITMRGREVDPLLANLIWSAKESALKVLRTGLRRDTRSVEVTMEPGPGDAWTPFTVAADGLSRPFAGWWRRYGEFVLTVAASHPTATPISLSASTGLATAEPVHSWLDQPAPIDVD
ncbi:MAG: 4'-phosphopantetheinyl transferase superfamily protein [Acidimicrobiia bacterium]|nr:4'-phosphopantetheinyl transferase superfamily protein [Acidimicrobiia bacterium]